MDSKDEKLTLWSFRLPRLRFVLALGFVLTLALGAVLERWLMLTNMPPNARPEFRVMSQAWNVIYNNYVDRDSIDPAVMAHRSIEGMIDSLGDSNHSAFLDRRMVKKAGTAMNGTLTGIGIEVQMKNRQPVIVAALDGSPALQAGLRAGEVISEVDGKAVTKMAPTQVIERISGPAGKPVDLTVLDPRTRRRSTVSVTRSSFKLNNVTWNQLPGTDVAHLRIALFSEGVTKDLRWSLMQIQKKGITNIILDLRDNPGGVLDEAIIAASEFLNGGNVLLEKHANGKVSAIAAEPGGSAQRTALAVLVNYGSASASEIVAGALRDAHRAKLIGEKTFGTGTVLTQFPLEDGSALLLAVEEWLTPSGRSFWHKGIEPDIDVPMGEILPLRPAAERGMTADDLRAYGDPQLLRALEIFHGKK